MSHYSTIIWGGFKIVKDQFCYVEVDSEELLAKVEYEVENYYFYIRVCAGGPERYVGGFFIEKHNLYKFIRIFEYMNEVSKYGKMRTLRN